MLVQADLCANTNILTNTLVQLNMYMYLFCLQAYTSQFVALVMFGLVMSEDRVSLQERRKDIIDGLSKLSGETIGCLNIGGNKDGTIIGRIHCTLYV